MSDVIQCEGQIQEFFRGSLGRKFKKEMLKIFDDMHIRIRIERVDEYDERVYR